MSKCRSCQAQILWAKTEHGKAIPLDPIPAANGNMILDERGTAKVVPKLSGFGSLYVSHFSSCPAAAQHRRRA